MQSGRLSEKQVVEAFHRYLKGALAQARAEHILDNGILTSAEADIMIAGPALCLYFAALRSNTNPPSVPLPDSDANGPVVLNANTCPPAFANFFALWASSIVTIKNLSVDQRYDLARVICDQPPQSSNPHPATNRLAADLRAAAIEISQRRTFQDRYGADLQAVLNSDTSPQPSAKAQFVPPPAYNEPPPHPTSPGRGKNPGDTGHLRPPNFSSSSHPSRESSRSRPASPTILTDEDPIIYLIRETLYASLADVLSLVPSLKALIRTDPARAYFASVSLAVVDVAFKAVTLDGDVKGVLGQSITLEECPDLLKPAMRELGGIARRVREISEEDDSHAMQLISEGRDAELAGEMTRMERLRFTLEHGSGAQEVSGEGRVSPNGSTAQLANRINALAMSLTNLSAFKERENGVFSILAGVR